MGPHMVCPCVCGGKGVPFWVDLPVRAPTGPHMCMSLQQGCVCVRGGRVGVGGG